MSEGTHLFFIYESDVLDIEQVQTVPIAIEDITGDVSFQLRFDDVAKKFEAYCSLDGGTEPFMAVGTAVTADISRIHSVAWRLEASRFGDQVPCRDIFNHIS